VRGLVEDILNPEQEARFHDLRKALRAVELIADMLPTPAAASSSCGRAPPANTSARRRPPSPTPP
jgi:hypothetical protein